MALSQWSIAVLYLDALILGAVLGLLYDAIRITRIFLGIHYSEKSIRFLQKHFSAKKKETDVEKNDLPGKKKRKILPLFLNPLIFVQDFLFSVTAGIACILLFYEVNHGKIRIPVFLAVGAGFFLYRATLGKTVMIFSEAIAYLVGRAARILWKAVTVPVCLLWKKTAGRIVLLAEKAARRRYTAKMKDRITKDACGLIPGGKERKHGRKTTEKAIQSESDRADLSRAAHHRFGRRVRGGSHAVQSTDQKAGKTRSADPSIATG